MKKKDIRRIMLFKMKKGKGKFDKELRKNTRKTHGSVQQAFLLKALAKQTTNRGKAVGKKNA